jgi:probable HAF family extracellular repeat protein
MKSKILTSIGAMIMSAAALALPVRAVARDQQKGPSRPVLYSVRILTTLGGTAGVGNSVNNKGWVSGAANLTGDATQHAALWRNGAITDLGTLGGPNSFINFPVKNERGEIEGFSQTSTPDPLGEAFCAGVTFNTFNGVTCLGFLWQDGVIAPLLPLAGGNNSQANGVNNSGQVVGVAENSIRDATCTPPQALQFEAVIWGPKKGQIQQLRPLSGDSDGFGTAINDNGEATGCSGICANVGVASCLHAVVWKDGSPTNIGGLGPLNVGGDIITEVRCSVCQSCPTTPPTTLSCGRRALSPTSARFPGALWYSRVALTTRGRLWGTCATPPTHIAMRIFGKTA